MTDLEIRLRALELAVQADSHNAAKLAEQFYAFLTTREKVATHKPKTTFSDGAAEYFDLLRNGY